MFTKIEQSVTKQYVFCVILLRLMCSASLTRTHNKRITHYNHPPSCINNNNTDSNRSGCLILTCHNTILLVSVVIDSCLADESNNHLSQMNGFRPFQTTVVTLFMFQIFFLFFTLAVQFHCIHAMIVHHISLNHQRIWFML
jgi:hypothetical protein